MSVVFYTAFLGAIGSIIGNGYIAVTEHNRDDPKSLSELAAAESDLLIKFRWIELVCSTLLAITVYWFIVPRNHYGFEQSLAWSLEYVGGILMATIPATKKLFTVHTVCAQAMGVGMLALAYLFLPALSDGYFIIGLICAVLMAAFGIATIVDKKRYIVHELAFIFISHITICIAALSLR